MMESWYVSLLFSLSSFRLIFCIIHKRCKKEAFIFGKLTGSSSPDCVFFDTHHRKQSQRIQSYMITDKKHQPQYLSFYQIINITLNISRPFSTL